MQIWIRWMRRGVMLALVLSMVQLVFQTHPLAPLEPHLTQVNAQPSVPYNLGNWTYVPRQMLPTFIGEGQIPIGSNWTFTYSFREGLKYHVYTLGDWIYQVNISRTDYDIYLVDPTGSYESNHTEAAGLPEHLGSTVSDPLYVPTRTGNYSYLIINDAKDSAGARNATLVAIEHLDTNRWYKDKLYLQGREYVQPNATTAWAYEFNSSSPRIEISVSVPGTLDMYEVRLYLMSNPAIGKGSYLSGMPVPWDRGLYGRTYYDSKAKYTMGGYNLNTTGYRGNALASCEYAGQDMFMNYTSPYTGNLLYHIVFIAEYGRGNLSLLIKTQFNKPVFTLEHPGAIVEAGTDVTLRALVNRTSLPIDHFLLEHSLNNGQTWNSTLMTMEGASTYSGMIPAQPEGTTVVYRVTAFDEAGNEAKQQLSYRNWKRSILSASPSSQTMDGGENITLTGQLVPSLQGLPLSINYTSPQGTVVAKIVETNGTGWFKDVFTPDTAGTWTVRAGWRGSEIYLPAVTNTNFVVRKLSVSASIAADKPEIFLGDKLEIRGYSTPILNNASFKLTLTDASGKKTTLQALTWQNGSFSITHTPIVSGQLTIQATYDGDGLHEAFTSGTVYVRVSPKPPPSFLETYFLYILVGGVAAAAVVGYFLFRRFGGRSRRAEPRLVRPRLVRR